MSAPVESSPGGNPVGNGTAPAFIALVTGAIAMGISPIFVRWADVGPLTSAFWRVALGLPALWLWMRMSERDLAPQKRFTRPTLLVGLTLAIDLVLWHMAIPRTSIANATFFATTAPIWVVVFGWLLFRQQAGSTTLLGLALCLSGGGFLIGESFQIRPEGLTGDALGVATGVFFGLYFLAVQAARKDAGAARVTFEASLITTVILLIAALAMEKQMLPVSLAGLGALLGMSWVSHVGGQGLLSVALGKLPATFSSLVIFLEAIAAALFAFLLLGEPISLMQGLGGLLIMIGIYVARPPKG